MKDLLARAVEKLATVWTEMADFWEFMWHHDRMQRQMIAVTVRQAVDKVRGRY